MSFLNGLHPNHISKSALAALTFPVAPSAIIRVVAIGTAHRPLLLLASLLLVPCCGRQAVAPKANDASSLIQLEAARKLLTVAFSMDLLLKQAALDDPDLDPIFGDSSSEATPAFVPPHPPESDP